MEIPLIVREIPQKFRHLTKCVDSKSAVLYNAYDSISARKCDFEKGWVSGMIYQPLLIRDHPYFIDISKIGPYPAHIHSEVEMLYCLEGELNMILQGEPYCLHANELVLVEKLMAHEIIGGSGKRMAIQVGSLFLGEQYKQFSTISFKDPVLSLRDLPEDAVNLRKLRELFAEISEEYMLTGKRYTSLNIRGNIYKICHIIMQEHLDQAKRPWHVTDDIHTVLELVHNHYNEPLDVETAAQKINYGKSSFCFHFKKVTGQTFHTYLNNFRIKKAVHLLSETSASIESIAYMVGFNDPKTFSRVFKAVTGISPRDYRKGSETYSLNVEYNGKNPQGTGNG